MTAPELTPTARIILERARRNLAPITIRALPYQCWRCHHQNQAVAVMHPEELTSFYDQYDAYETPGLDYARELQPPVGSVAMSRRR